LKYLTYLEEPSIAQMMLTQYTKATNMTEQMSAMSCLCQIASPESEEVLDHFYKKWHKDPLVMMKWFAVQAASKLPGTLDRVKVLMNNPSFDVKIPNLVRSLQGTFIENMSQFHAIDGSGYEFIADQIIELDGINPHLSSRFVKGFNKLDKFDSQRKRLMKQALKRIMDKQDLSSNVYEIASNILEK
jgi:aminopeptidase N